MNKNINKTPIMNKNTIREDILELLRKQYLNIDGQIKPIDELYRELDITLIMDHHVHKMLVDVEEDIARYDGVDG